MGEHYIEEAVEDDKEWYDQRDSMDRVEDFLELFPMLPDMRNVAVANLRDVIRDIVDRSGWVAGTRFA